MARALPEEEFRQADAAATDARDDQPNNGRLGSAPEHDGTLGQGRDQPSAVRAKRSNAERAIAALFGEAPPTSQISNETLIAEVTAWCEKNKLGRQMPGADTILQAAGRRS
jgi:hypothetical protein